MSENFLCLISKSAKVFWMLSFAWPQDCIFFVNTRQIHGNAVDFYEFIFCTLRIIYFYSTRLI